MKILHCCLAAFYIDNFSYQENILPKIHKLQGHDVKILASTENYIDNVRLGYEEPKQYLNENGIIVKRIPYVKWLPLLISKKLRIYNGILEYVKEFAPDIIYLHDCQFVSINIFIRYVKKYPVKIIVDTHTDFINSGKNWISKNILHKIIYRWCAKRVEKYASVFYATLPLRGEFLHEVYGIKKSKIQLLPFGVDDTLFSYEEKNTIKDQVRKSLGFSKDDFVISSGGKIDERKNIDKLLKCFTEIQNQNAFKKIKLLVFGKPVPALKGQIDFYAKHKDVVYLEWVKSAEIHRYFMASDLVIFPGTHSVLWEEAVGLGLPCVFKHWEGITHVDLGGNCLFLDKSDEDSINLLLLNIFTGKIDIKSLAKVAEDLGPKKFSYTQIAHQAINI